MNETKKICTCCNELKELSAFAKKKRNKSGYDSMCRVCKNNKLIKYRNSNIDKTREWGKQNSKRQREKNQEKCQMNKKNAYNKKRDYYKKKWREYAKFRSDTDVNFRLRQSLRQRVYSALKLIKKSESTSVLIGCEIEFLKKHLEKNFKDGMSWDNYGEWHIDHIKPCAVFDLSDKEQQRECFNYMNLQPLWAIENIKKSNKYYG
jgi:hypothetical protein